MTIRFNSWARYFAALPSEEFKGRELAQQFVREYEQARWSRRDENSIEHVCNWFKRSKTNPLLKGNNHDRQSLSRPFAPAKQTQVAVENGAATPSTGSFRTHPQRRPGGFAKCIAFEYSSAA
jgi:hypothetical protein